MLFICCLLTDVVISYLIDFFRRCGMVCVTTMNVDSSEDNVAALS